MTAATAPQPSMPQWLVDGVMGLVASAYQAGRADRSAEVESTPPAEQDVLDRREAAKLLRSGLTKLDGLVRDGVIPSFQIGGRRMFHRAELLAYLGGQR